jgi:acyl-CoA reductase-like NAD-dependent aldehyde dehydrogenase
LFKNTSQNFTPFINETLHTEAGLKVKGGSISLFRHVQTGTTAHPATSHLTLTGSVSTAKRLLGNADQCQDSEHVELYIPFFVARV